MAASASRPPCQSGSGPSPCRSQTPWRVVTLEAGAVTVRPGGRPVDRKAPSPRDGGVDRSVAPGFMAVPPERRWDWAALEIEGR